VNKSRSSTASDHEGGFPSQVIRSEPIHSKSVR
jgi:hypothetical protein